VLRRIFGPKRDEIRGEWRRQHEELYNPYSLPNIIRVTKSRTMRWLENLAFMETRKAVWRVLVEKTEGKRQLGRPRRRWEDNIKMDIQEVGWGYGLDWSASG
jgi:hypothetical protein